MTPERWKQVSGLFKSALALSGGRREEYLDAACAGDPALRRRVESLLSAHDAAQQDEFINLNAMEIAAPWLSAGSQLAKGQAVNQYEIVERIGVGGMGEVFLALDTRLKRRVALKVLPRDVATDEERMRRFDREARAASALNHPNILVVYEVGESGGLDYIATEFVEGVTLRQRMAGGQLTIDEAIDIGIQIASALAAAHDAGIVHRDVKPENIMLRADGYAKLLDFGIAKLNGAARASEAGAASPETSLLRTAPGTALGTVSYMSPEQARGLGVDARTDVWSLGVTLYEMVAGARPFAGETQNDVISLILRVEPPPLRQSAPDAPGELQRIVGKALTKDRESRYQTARELHADLQRLRLRREVERAAGAGTTGTAGIETNAEEPRAQADARARRRALSYPSGRRALIYPSLAAALLLAAVAAAAFWKSKPAQVPTRPAPAAEVHERQLSYWLTVQKYRDGRPYRDPFRLAGEMNFEEDYRVRLHVSSPQAGYLYVLNEGPPASGRTSPFNILFPSPTANGGSAALGANQQAQIPERSWFSFDGEAGTEKLWLIWAADSVPELEAARKFANPADAGVVSDPDVHRGIVAFLTDNSAQDARARKDDGGQETRVTAAGRALVYAVRLEHH